MKVPDIRKRQAELKKIADRQTKEQQLKKIQHRQEKEKQLKKIQQHRNIRIKKQPIIEPQPDKATMEMLKDMGAKISHERLPPPYINTVAGKAKWVTTEYEDEYGRWNDRYSTAMGYWVIHEGNKHHVYKVIR